MSEEFRRFVSFQVDKGPGPEEDADDFIPLQKVIDAREVEGIANNQGKHSWQRDRVTIRLRSGRLTEDIDVYEPYEQVVSKIQEALR